MSESTLILRQYVPDDWTAVNKLSVRSAQQKFVATIDELFRKPKVHWRYHVIEVEDQIVGFFNLDLRYWVEYDFARSGEIGVRSFFIDRHHQGHGYATAAALLLPNFVFAEYPKCPSLCLTVNCKNPSAYRCYNKAGFYDTQELYLGGSAGPQNIMRCSRAERTTD